MSEPFCDLAQSPKQDQANPPSLSTPPPTPLLDSLAVGKHLDRNTQGIPHAFQLRAIRRASVKEYNALAFDNLLDIVGLIRERFNDNTFCNKSSP